MLDLQPPFDINNAVLTTYWSSNNFNESNSNLSYNFISYVFGPCQKTFFLPSIIKETHKICKLSDIILLK